MCIIIHRHLALTTRIRVPYSEVYPRLKWKLYLQPPPSFEQAAPHLQPLFLFNVEPSHYFEWQVRVAGYAPPVVA